MRITMTLTAALLTLMLGATGCSRDEGPAERAGEAIDEAMEETGNAVEKAGREIDEAIEEAEKKRKEADEEN